MRITARRGVLTAFAALGLTLCVAACADLNDASGTFEPNRDNVLTVMTQPMPTAGFWEGTARHPTGGFEYELAEELASRLGLDGVLIRTESFSRIVSGDLDGADIAMALLTPTPDREEVLDFTTPYIQSPPALITRSGTSVPDVRAAQKLQFAVGRNTTFETITESVIRPSSPPLTFENRNREIQAVLNGKADVAMFDMTAAQAIVNDDPHLSIAARLASTEPIAAALPEGSPNVDAVGSALRAMESDGTIDDLAEDWLGSSLTDSAEDTPLIRTSP